MVSFKLKVLVFTIREVLTPIIAETNKTILYSTPYVSYVSQFVDLFQCFYTITGDHISGKNYENSLSIISILNKNNWYLNIGAFKLNMTIGNTYGCAISNIILFTG